MVDVDAHGQRGAAWNEQHEPNRCCNVRRQALATSAEGVDVARELSVLRCDAQGEKQPSRCDDDSAGRNGNPTVCRYEEERCAGKRGNRRHLSAGTRRSFTALGSHAVCERDLTWNGRPRRQQSGE